MYPVINSLKNILRQYRRYRVLIPLLLVCALLSGAFLTLAVPCRVYSDQKSAYKDAAAEEEAVRLAEQDDRARDLGETASLLQFGVMLVGAAAILYVSSLMIGERMFDVGILYSLGLSRGQIFVSMLIELVTVCAGTITVGLAVGRVAAEAYLKHRIAEQILPEEILYYMETGTAEMLCIAVSAGILILPVLRLTVRLLRTDPCGFLRDRK